MRIDASSAHSRAKTHSQVRTAKRNPTLRCPPLICPPLGPPELSSLSACMQERERERREREREGRRREERGGTAADPGRQKKKKKKENMYMELPPVQVPDVRCPANRRKEAKKGHPGRPPEEKEEKAKREGERDSGKKKAHKHKSFWPVTLSVTRGSPDRETRGQSFMYYPRNPRNINIFVRIPDREDRWPGRPERVLCAKVLCAFSAP